MLLRQSKAGDGDARVEMGLRGNCVASRSVPREKGALECERRRFMGRVTGGRDGDEDGVSMFSGGLMAAAG